MPRFPSERTTSSPVMWQLKTTAAGFPTGLTCSRIALNNLLRSLIIDTLAYQIIVSLTEARMSLIKRSPISITGGHVGGCQSGYLAVYLPWPQFTLNRHEHVREGSSRQKNCQTHIFS